MNIRATLQCKLDNRLIKSVGGHVRTVPLQYLGRPMADTLQGRLEALATQLPAPTPCPRLLSMYSLRRYTELHHSHHHPPVAKIGIPRPLRSYPISR
jgi:hypothetical protein